MFGKESQHPFAKKWLLGGRSGKTFDMMWMNMDGTPASMEKCHGPQHGGRPSARSAGCGTQVKGRRFLYNQKDKSMGAVFGRSTWCSAHRAGLALPL